MNVSEVLCYSAKIIVQNVLCIDQENYSPKKLSDLNIYMYLCLF